MGELTPLWLARPDPLPPRMNASCVRHGTSFPLCDHCASVPAMARWSSALTRDELTSALVMLARGEHYYANAEERAVLYEAARRIQEQEINEPWEN